MSDNKCFCHLNGFEVKDAKARNSIETLNNTTSEISEDVSLLETRMDTFIALPEGTTTADAEIIDARIGADGTAYANLGEHIRKNSKSIYKPFEKEISPIFQSGYNESISVSKLNGVYHVETTYTEGQSFWACTIPLNKKQEQLRSSRIVVKIHNTETINNANCIVTNKWNAWAGTGITTQWEPIVDNICEIKLLESKDFGDLDLHLIIQSLSPQQTVSFDFSVYEIPVEQAPNITPYAIESKHSLTADSLNGFNKEDYVKFEDVEEITNGNYITCWGDSLTAQGGWTTKLSELSGRELYNAGTGGENANTITARQGADVMMVNDITIPADKTPVLIANYSTGIRTEFNKIAKPLLQGGSNHVNPVTIAGVEGTLNWTGSAYNDTSGTWTFTRSVAGDEVVINRPTAIVTAYDRTRNNPYLMTIFMGQNGGYDDISELINKHKLMIEHSNAKNVIVLGLSSGTAEGRAEYESEMKKAFGRYFISLRDYLSKYGLADAGLTPTEADTTAMNEGSVPPQLLADSVHYTSACKTVIGNMLYKKCKDLNIF